ncbi:DEAD/DEAH box RNA helicase [Thraustotheca clavata]|uniref:RNA helicase n=1 Tax=Thraustotheca clavata TaxID=74557 RepID=A0A1W0A3G3_9STRA|nr:DEAD/DEAH box RNA helicase [Thraustotheca clavata]
MTSGVNSSLLAGDVPFSACGFGLDKRLSKACAKLQFVHATLVQKHCIPLALQGKDLLVRARTGSGKTAAFSLPVLQKILAANSNKKGIKAIILVPTKELVDQTRAHIWELMYYCRDVISVLGLSGQSVSAQQALLRDIPDILISTPSRLVIHLEAGNVDLKSSVHTIVMDEADLVLSFGYGEDVKKIFNALPKICQHFFMSATLSPELDALKKVVLHNPAIVKLEEGHTDGKLQQYYLPVPQKDKDLLVYALIKFGVIHGKVIFFVNTTSAAYRIKLLFEQFSIKAAVLNAKLPHNSRQHIIQQFNRGMIDYLIATDDSVDKDEGDDETDSDEEEEENEDNDQVEEVEEENEEKDDDVEESENDEEDHNEDDDVDNEEAEDDDDDDDDEPMLDGEEAPEFGSFGDSDEEEDQKEKKPKAESEGFGVSRGVDFRGVTFVVNIEFPTSVKSYTHRIGRTARGGANGTALSFVATDDVNEKRVLEKVQTRQQPVLLESQDLVKQPAPLAFNMEDINCLRYRVEDVRRAVTRVAVREAQLNDVKKEMLNSEKLRSHFQDHPRELNLLQHDKQVGKARIQPHLAALPTYLIPAALQAPAPTKKRKANHSHKKNHKRRTDNDPLHTFTHDEKPKEEEGEEDRITYGDRGVGKSTSNRQKWKSARKMGRFNPKTIQKKARKAALGSKH